MTYLQTSYFLEVAQNKSISKTASNLYVSPPAISKQIALLEKELGIQLFDRTSGRMELTPAGEIMYNHFANQQTAFEASFARAKKIESVKQNVLHLGILARWDLWDEFRQLKEKMKKSPSCTDVELHYCFNPGDNNLLNKGELDAVICPADDILLYARQQELNYVELAEIPRIFLFSADNDLARKKKPKPADFNDIPLLVLSSKSVKTAHHNNLKLCHSLNLQPDIIFKDTLEDLLLAVGMNEGFFICDSWLNHSKQPHLKCIPVPDTQSIVLAWWAHNKAPGLRYLIECCRNEICWPVSI